MDWNQGLAGEHLKIASSNHRRIAVLAGPGTGKTTYGIMRRVARLLQEGVDPRKILLLSFTRTAAEDLKTKLVQQLTGNGIAEAERVTTSTVHSLAFRMLMDEGILENNSRTARILLKHEENLMLHDLKRDGRNFNDCQRLLKEYETGWATEVGSYPGPTASPDQNRFVHDLFDWLTNRRAILMGEVVPIINGFLRSNPHNEYIDKYEHIIVDEFQDLNQLEQDTILQLAGRHGSVMVVGDDDQSIYSWRHANPEGIVAFASSEGTQKFCISVCGRSPKNLVQVANNVRSHMPASTKGDLESLSEVDGYVANVNWKSLGAEVEGIADAVVSRVRDGKVSPGDVLVLVNRTMIGKEIRDEVHRQGIQAVTYFSQDALDTRSARRGLAILMLADQYDAASWRVLLGLTSPKNGTESDGDGHATAIQKINEMAELDDQDEITILSRIVAGEKLKYPRHQLRTVVANFEMATQELEHVRSITTAEAVNHVFPVNNTKTKDIREICISLLSSGHTDIGDLVRELVTRITQLDVPEAAMHVRIMTLHKSKGLTAKMVFVTSLVNGILPSMRAGLSVPERRRREEEGRRLLYVAITRASEELVLSSFQSLPNRVLDPLMIPAKKGPNGFARVQASQYFLEIIGTLGLPVKGELWLPNYKEIYCAIDDMDNNLKTIA